MSLILVAVFSRLRYGRLIAVEDKTKYRDRAQHMGFGKRLLQCAESIALRNHGLPKIAVISGDGVKTYYRHNGYQSEGQYLTKTLI